MFGTREQENDTHKRRGPELAGGRTSDVASLSVDEIP